MSLVIVMVAAMPIAYMILINPNFYESIYCVPILMIAMYFANISGFYGGIFTAYKQTKIMGTTTMVSAAINIILNIALIWKFGLYAAAFSTLIANVVTAEYRRRKVRKYIILNEDVRTYISFAVTCAIVLFLFYSNNIYCWILNIIIGLLYALLTNIDLIKIVLKELGKLDKRK